MTFSGYSTCSVYTLEPGQCLLDSRSGRWAPARVLGGNRVKPARMLDQRPSTVKNLEGVSRVPDAVSLAGLRRDVQGKSASLTTRGQSHFG